MMYRSSYRAAARAALALADRTAGMTQLTAWAGNIDADLLPVLGVVTPQEQSERSTHDSYERSTLLQVVVKRLGGDDIEDVLDADAAEIEPRIMQAIEDVGGVQCLLDSLSITVGGDGEQKIGTLIATFRVTSWRSLGA